jgi:hypothetical protein
MWLMQLTWMTKISTMGAIKGVSMRTTARHLPKQKVDIPAFVDNLRRFNKQAVQIVNAPLVGGTGAKHDLRKELRGALDELEETVRALRVVVIGFPSSPERVRASTAAKPAARPASASAPPVMDTTEAMVKKGQLVAPAEFQALMGWASRQAVWKAAESHRVFYLTYKAERYFPIFYGDPAYDRKHLEAVTKVLGDLPGGSKLQFFLTRKGSLGGDTPLQALAAGRFAKVKDVAAAFAEVPMEA